MEKFMIFLFLFCSPVFCFGQNQFQGFYQAQFFNLFGDVKIIRADFEVKNDGSIVGKIDAGGAVKTFQGQAAKGKFEARTALENNAVTIIKGEFPSGKNQGKISLVERAEQKGGGSKSVSENGITGFIKQVPPPEKLEDLQIADTGKTLLWIQSSNPYFDKEWANPAIATEKIVSGDRMLEIEIKTNTVPRADRGLNLKLFYRPADQKIWTKTDMLDTTYYENKFDAGGNLASSNRFRGIGVEARGGQIEIVSETENEIVLKLTNLKIKRLVGDDFVQIDGYIHAVKNKS